MERLSDDQNAQVKEILSQFDSSTITATDAKSIFKAFQEAGLLNGASRFDLKA